PSPPRNLHRRLAVNPGPPPGAGIPRRRLLPLQAAAHPSRMARYHEIPLGELVDAIRRLHGQMCEQRTRTQAERAELAREVRQLLGALPRRIAPDPYMPHEPEYVLRKLDRETIE